MKGGKIKSLEDFIKTVSETGARPLVLVAPDLFSEVLKDPSVRHQDTVQATRSAGALSRPAAKFWGLWVSEDPTLSEGTFTVNRWQPNPPPQ